MKRTAITLSVVAVILVIAIPGGAFFLGSAIQTATEAAFAKANTYLSPQVGELSLPVYNKGLMSSEVISQISLNNDEEEDLSLALNHEIYHGPVAFTPDGVKVGYAYVITTLNRDVLPEELVAGMGDVYGETEPFKITSLVDYAGGQKIDINIAGVDHKDGTLTFRFDGGSGSFKANSNGITSGNMELTPLSLRNDSKEDSEDFIVRIKGSSLSIGSTGGSTMEMEGVVGGIEWRFAGGDLFDPFTISLGELTLLSSQTAISEGSSLMTGTSSASVPSLKFRIGEDFDLSINDLAVETTSTSNGGMLTAEVVYSAGGITSGMEIPAEFSLYSDMAKEGAEVNLHATLPVSIAEDFAKIQQQVQMAGFSQPEGDMPPEVEKELADAMENAVKGITKGTNIGLGVRLGGGETETSVAADFSYMGSKPMVEQKTILELIKSLEVTAKVNLPGAIVESNPMIMEQLTPLVATGAIVQNGSSFAMDAKLKEGTLETNGQVNPILDQMGPMLMGEISWEEMFQGMREGVTQ